MGKLKRTVLIVAAVAAVGGMSAGAVALRAYHEATKIDRSHPESVVGEYVDAFLVQRDDRRTDLFTCSSPDLAAMASLRMQLIQEEQDRGVRTQIVLGVSQMMDEGRQVTTQLQLSQGTGVDVRTRVQSWRFTLADEDGWRVCGAEQIPAPSPSATPPTAS
jgi:hypothetical protein